MDDRHGMSHRCATCQYSTHNFARYKQHVSLDYQDIKGYSYRRPSIFYPHKTARFPLDAIRLENNDPKNSVQYTCDQCNYSCSAKHSLTKHKNSCHSAIKSSPARLSKPQNFPPTPIDLQWKKKQPSPEQKNNRTNPKNKSIILLILIMFIKQLESRGIYGSKENTLRRTNQESRG